MQNYNSNNGNSNNNDLKRARKLDIVHRSEIAIAQIRDYLIRRIQTKTQVSGFDESVRVEALRDWREHKLTFYIGLWLIMSFIGLLCSTLVSQSIFLIFCAFLTFLFSETFYLKLKLPGANIETRDHVQRFMFATSKQDNMLDVYIAIILAIVLPALFFFLNKFLLSVDFNLPELISNIIYRLSSKTVLLHYDYFGYGLFLSAIALMNFFKLVYRKIFGYSAMLPDGTKSQDSINKVVKSTSNNSESEGFE